MATVVRRALLTGATVVIAIALYALGSLAAVPSLVNWAVHRYAESGPERTARVARIYVNPFTLDVVLQDVEVSDFLAGTSFAAGFIRLDFSSASVLERRPVFDIVVIERAALQVGSRQVGALVPEMQIPRAPRVERLELRAGSVETINSAGPAGRELTLSDISLTATSFDFQTEDEAQDPSRYALHAAAPGGGEIDLEGSLTIGLKRARGRISVRNLDLGTIQPWFAEQLAPFSPQGLLDWSGEYVLSSFATMPELEVLGGRAELIDFAFRPAPNITVNASRLSGTTNGTLRREQDMVTYQGRIEILDAALELVDTRLTPPESFTLSEVAVAMAADPDAQQLTIDIQGRLGDQAHASLTMGMLPERDPSTTFAMEITDLHAAMLSRYSERSIGRALDDGRADVVLSYGRSAERIDGNLRVITRDLSLSAVDPELASAYNRPSLDLAAALLEDAQGVIQIEVPFTTNEGSVEDAAVNALNAQLSSLIVAPFAELGAIVGRDADELRIVPFDAGIAALGADALGTINALAEALRERPRLGVRLPLGFDPVMDRDALARQQIELHVLLATAGPSGQPRPESVDFTSPRAHDVLNEFANERLTPAQLASIARPFECTADVACNSAYYAAMFDALVANEPISDAALNRLGRFRAQSITDALTERGMEPERIDPATDAAVAGGPFRPVVPIEVRVSRPD